MKSKQTLKVGQKYRVIKDDYNSIYNKNLVIPRIVTVKDIGVEDCFFDEYDCFYDISQKSNFKLQLITQKKEVKNKIEQLLKEFESHIWHPESGRKFGIIELEEKYFIDFKKKLLAKQSTPKKKYKEIKEIDFENVELMEFKEFYKMLEIPKNCEASNRSNAILIMFRNQCKLIRNQKKIQDTINY